MATGLSVSPAPVECVGSAEIIHRVKIHLDTDLGGDPDDVCALALLLRSPDTEITGITTVLDGNGQRAAYNDHVLELARCSSVPVIAGAGCTLTGNQARPGGAWPDLPPHPAAPGAALDLLAASVALGTTQSRAHAEAAGFPNWDAAIRDSPMTCSTFTTTR